MSAPSCSLCGQVLTGPVATFLDQCGETCLPAERWTCVNEKCRARDCASVRPVAGARWVPNARASAPIGRAP